MLSVIARSGRSRSVVQLVMLLHLLFADLVGEHLLQMEPCIWVSHLYLGDQLAQRNPSSPSHVPANFIIFLSGILELVRVPLFLGHEVSFR